MSDLPEKWNKQTFRLPENHGLVVKPGYNVFIADRGSVGFCYPRDWIVRPGKKAIKLHDREPPDDDCVIQVTVFHLPIVQGGWEALPLKKLLLDSTGSRKQGMTRIGDVRTENRLDYEMAWGDVRFMDKKENRQVRSRCVLARARLVQPLITMDFWESELAKFGPVWDELLATLKVGVELPEPPRPEWN